VVYIMIVLIGIIETLTNLQQDIGRHNGWIEVDWWIYWEWVERLSDWSVEWVGY